MKLEFNNYDLQIITTKQGDRVCQIRPNLAFDPDFIADMESKGVKEYTREETEQA